MADVGLACWRQGELGLARPLLERAARDVKRHLGRGHDVRLQILAALRDLFVDQRDYEKAGAVQRKVLDCQVERLGAEHPDAVTARTFLARILIDGSAPRERDRI
jgi:Tetratricopeptide repeat